MSWVAVAIGGSALVGAGTSLYGADKAADAAREGGNIAADAAGRAQQLQREMFLQSMRQVQPFINFGRDAGGTLSNQVVSPAERANQYERQRIDLQGQIDRLSEPKGYHNVPQVFGEKGSERWGAAITQAEAARQAEVHELKTKLSTLSRQADFDAQKGTESITASPLYEFQRDLGERNIKRMLSSTGRQDTGFGAETLSNFYRALGAEEADRQQGRLYNLTTMGANVAAQQATNTVNSGNAQADMISRQGQFQGQGIAQAGQMEGAGIQGVGRTFQQSAMMLALFGKNGFGGGDPTALGGSNDYIGGTGDVVNVRPGFGGQPELITQNWQPPPGY